MPEEASASIKKILDFKYKYRNDSITDRYNHVFMVKAMLVASFIIGLNWYQAEITCMIPKTAAGEDKDKSFQTFVSQACWINGLYVYRELKHIKNFKGYYGIPMNLEHNGTLQYYDNPPVKTLTCAAYPHTPRCKSMEKVFYLQHQWFPFFLSLLGLLFYIPYVLFTRINADFVGLMKCLGADEEDDKILIKTFFNNRINNPNQQSVKLLLNVIVKVLYLIANVLAFVFTDRVLNGDFKRYGTNWINWDRLSNTDQHNYIGFREFVKAGEMLLPTFGLCDVLELSKDLVHQLFNEHRFVCELKQNILYQFALAVLWFLLIVGMIVSSVGIILCLLKHFYRTRHEIGHKGAPDRLSMRQREYLDLVRKADIIRYQNLIKLLNSQREYSGKNE